MPLKATDCKLLPDGSPLPKLYNEVERLLGAAKTEFANALDAKQVAKVQHAVEEAKELLTRDRYRVGFLGPSQLGKSTSLNNVVKAKLSSSGGGGPATSTVSRFRPHPVGTPAKATLQYLSSVNFQRRRYALANCLDKACPGLELKCPSPNPAKAHDAMQTENVEFLSKLDVRLAEDERSKRRGIPTIRCRRRTSLPTRTCTRSPGFCERFRPTAANSCSSRAHEVTVPLDAKRDLSEQICVYTNHQADAAGNPNDLLWQVQVDFPTADASPKIELIDLPGLGVSRESDDLTTLAFMDELDGALVFTMARQSRDSTVMKILKRLYGDPDNRWEFSKPREALAGRVWMVVTFVEGLTEEQYGIIGNSKEMFLDHLSKTLDEFNVDKRHALFVGNQFHRKLVEDKQPLAALHQHVMNLKLGSDGQPILPPKFKDHPELEKGFLAVLQDGGIQRVRDVIADELAVEVQAVVCRHVAQTLRKAATDLAQHIDTVRKAGTFGHKEFAAAQSWAVAAHRIAGDRSIDDPAHPAFRELLTQAGRVFTGVKKQLRTEFGTIAVQSIGNLRDLHEGYAWYLTGKGVQQSGAVVKELFGWVCQRFTDAGKNILAVPIDGQERPDEALHANLEKDGEGETFDWCLAPFHSIADPLFFPSRREEAGGRPLSFEQYQKIMLFKIDAATHETAHRAVTRSKMRLKEIRDRLAFLARKENQTKIAVDPERLAKAATELSSVAEQLKAEIQRNKAI